MNTAYRAAVWLFVGLHIFKMVVVNVLRMAVFREQGEACYHCDLFFPFRVLTLQRGVDKRYRAVCFWCDNKEVEA